MKSISKTEVLTSVYTYWALSLATACYYSRYLTRCWKDYSDFGLFGCDGISCFGFGIWYNLHSTNQRCCIWLEAIWAVSSFSSWGNQFEMTWALCLGSNNGMQVYLCLTTLKHWSPASMQAWRIHCCTKLWLWPFLVRKL